MATTVTFIEEVDGRTIEREEEVSSSNFQVKLETDGGTQLLSPAVVTQVEMEQNGDTAPTQDQCGNTERQKAGNSGWLVRVQGIITGNAARSGNLDLATVRDTIAFMDTLSIRTDLVSGEFVLSNIVVTDPNDLVSIQTKQTAGVEDAYEFSLQLGEEQSE